MDILAISGSTMATNSGLLTATGAETVYDTTVIIEYMIDGVLYRLAAATDGTTPTTDIVTGSTFVALQPDETCWFTWCVNAAGTVAVTQGNVQSVDGDTDLMIDGKHPRIPGVPDGYCPFAIQRIQTTGASSAWTFGTGNWNATGVTDLILNVGTLPARPPTTVTA